MPYSNVKELPNYIQAEPLAQREKWMAVWDSVCDDCVADGRESAYCEGEAFRAANAAIKETDYQSDIEVILEYGTASSGNYGHKGVKGKRGGSASGSGKVMGGANPRDEGGVNNCSEE